MKFYMQRVSLDLLRPNVSVGVPRAQAAVTTSAIKQTTKGKKTIRKGNVVVTGASSGLGLATAKALAETSKWNVIMACRDFLKAEKGRQVRRHGWRELRRYAPRPCVVGQRPPVREELSAAIRNPARWACLQCCGLVPYCQGAQLHRWRVRDECWDQPPRPLPLISGALRGLNASLPLEASHHRRAENRHATDGVNTANPITVLAQACYVSRVMNREYKHFGRERAAEGELRRPPGARRGIPRAE